MTLDPSCTCLPDPEYTIWVMGVRDAACPVHGDASTFYREVSAAAESLLDRFTDRSQSGE